MRRLSSRLCRKKSLVVPVLVDFSVVTEALVVPDFLVVTLLEFDDFEDSYLL